MNLSLNTANCSASFQKNPDSSIFGGGGKKRDFSTVPDLSSLKEIQQVVSETLLSLKAGHLLLNISFNNRFSARLGDAHWTYKRIRFSKPLWPNATKLQRYQCVVHEVAHIVAHERYGRGIGKQIKPHGYEWKRVMREMGLNPDRCHNVPTEGVTNKKAKFKTYCKCRGDKKLHLVTRKVYERITNPLKSDNYYCRRCKAPLTIKPQD